MASIENLDKLCDKEHDHFSLPIKYPHTNFDAHQRSNGNANVIKTFHQTLGVHPYSQHSKTVESP